MGIWPFKKRVATLLKGGIMNGFTDWHSHILPGVDDGVPDMETSLATLRTYEEMGVKRVWLTPHIMEDYPNTPEGLRERFAALQQAWDGKVELRLAAEHMLDSLFRDRLDSRQLMPIGEDGTHLLVETSYFTPPMDFDDMIDGIQSAGYYPILAHPERYRYMNEADYKDLRRRGVLFQINMMSTVGMYGETARGKAEWLLSNGMAELTGTDLHRLSATQRHLDTAPRHRETLDRILSVAAGPKVD